ncbi:unnamed protein product [Pseudo-nitzschia multistriata]|uniref:Peptidase M11 gametolysin domain-containing protein n=1 Tax=Pseudo-nitzschia multistriata TaxID=183589 RepID=A0A448ZFN6_9STRA|nr:unnamed protein product [Pseudo-nitzschia multistriata]
MRTVRERKAEKKDVRIEGKKANSEVKESKAEKKDIRIEGKKTNSKHWKTITCVPITVEYEGEVEEIPDEIECDRLNDDEWGNSDTVRFAEDYSEVFDAMRVVSNKNRITFKGRIRKQSGNDVLEINLKQEIEVSKHTNKYAGNRKLREGSHTVLVIRVTDKDNHAPMESQQQLSESIFGGSLDKVGLATQMEACSGGNLMYKPVDDNPDTNTKGGVVELRIPYSVLDYGPYTPNDLEDWDRRKLERDVMTELVKQFPIYRSWKQYAHIMIVLPKETDFRQVGSHGTPPIAYAYVGGRRSVYKDPYGSHVWVQIHEVGHNNGLGMFCSDLQTCSI